MTATMSPDLMLLIADRAGVYVFAISGGIVGVRREMDLFGVIVLSFLPAIGGGTLRDLILDVPVFWLTDSITLLIAMAGGATAFFFHRTLERSRPLRWADAAGLALFAVAGAAKTHELGHEALVVLMMGVMTASAGGVLRDVVANLEPLLFKQDIYATAALLGAGIYILAIGWGSGDGVALSAGFLAAFTLRAAAIIFGLSMPKSPF